MHIAKLLLLQAAVAWSFTVDICLLYIGTDHQFSFGALESSGRITKAQDFSWTEVLTGIDAGEDRNTFYVQPVAGPSSTSSRISQSSLSLRDDDGNVSVATIFVKSAQKVTTTYAALQTIEGYPGSPAFTSLNLDISRNQMVGAMQGNGEDYRLIADVFPQNGTTSKVWVDFTAIWETWGFLKVGVSAYDSKRGVYYMVAGVSHVETLTGFALGMRQRGQQPAYTPFNTSVDVFALRYSTERDTLVAMVSYKATNQVAFWELPAGTAASGASLGNWTETFAYTPAQAIAMDLGQMEMDTGVGPDVLVAAVGIPSTNGFAVSWVDLTARKEVNRVVLSNPAIVVADIALCTV